MSEERTITNNFTGRIFQLWTTRVSHSLVHFRSCKTDDLPNIDVIFFGSNYISGDLAFTCEGELIEWKPDDEKAITVWGFPHSDQNSTQVHALRVVIDENDLEYHELNHKITGLGGEWRPPGDTE